MRKLLYILLLIPFFSSAQIVFETNFDNPATTWWTTSSVGTNLWEYETDRGEPRLTDHVSAAISVGRGGTGNAIWLGDYNNNITRNEIGKAREIGWGEFWVGYSIYVNEAIPNSRTYSQFRNLTDPADPNHPNQGVVNPITLRQFSAGKMYWSLATDPTKVDVIAPSGASTGTQTWPAGGFDYNLNEWIDIVIHYKGAFGASYAGADTSWITSQIGYDPRSDGYIQIWINGTLIVNHTGTTTYRYSNRKSDQLQNPYDGDLKFTIGVYWSSEFSPQGNAYYDEYKAWVGAGTYEDVSPLGLSPGGTPPETTPVTSTVVVPTTDKMLVAGTRQLYETIYPVTATDLTGTWSTSNGSVATVSTSGLVTAVGVGSCTITFTPTDQTNTPSDTTSITVESSSTEDSIMVLKPHGYYTPTSLTATTWNDDSGFELHGTEVGAISETGSQATFDGSSYYRITDVNDVMDYTPGTDSFTLIWREGDTSPTSSGYAISKADLTPRQYGAAYSDGNFQSIYVGGSLEATVLAPSVNPNRLFIAVIEPTQYNVWADGVHIITNSTAVGTGLSTSDVNIGGRTNGSYLMNSGATLDIVATIPKAISTAEREAIESEFQVNGVVASNSTKPTGGLNSSPIYYLGTTKKIINAQQ